jgi:uncharacterized protein
MPEFLYVILMSNIKPLDRAVVGPHVRHLAALDDAGQLVLCGPYIGEAGGIVIVRADSLAQARQIAESDPFISQGYKSYELRFFEPATRENNYLL